MKVININNGVINRGLELGFSYAHQVLSLLFYDLWDQTHN